MSTIVSRLDLTQIFCDVDDFCFAWERMWQETPQLPSMTSERRSKSKMHISEIMTIVIAFHGSGYRTFKDFYTRQVLPGWGKAFPNLVKQRGLGGFPHERLLNPKGQLQPICGVNALVFDVVVLFSTYTNW